MKIPLLSGAYRSRALAASAQSCINLFPEQNPEDISPTSPFTHYPRPGLIQLGNVPTQGRGRGVFRVSNGDLYGIVGPNVYYIDPNWNYNLLGSIQNQFTPVSMADNGQSNGNEIVLVDNSPLGYQINMTSRQMTQIVDTTGLFTGATFVNFFDTFFTFNQIGTNNWYCSLSEQVAFNALDQASKGTFGDPIQGLVVCQRTQWLIGAMTSEPWFDAGDPIFPFEEVFGQLVPHGTIAPYSICTTDVNAFYLSQDKDGRAIFIQIQGYRGDRVSTYALEDEWITYPRLTDAISYTYQQGGHTFVVIHFPSANKSWAYDLSTKQWHQRVWIDQNGTFNRERVAFHAFAYNTNVGMDWETGQIYALDQNTFTDVGQPIAFVRSFPHVVDELLELTITDFVVDMQTGTLSGSSDQALQAAGGAWSSGFSSGFGPGSGGTSGPSISFTPALNWSVTTTGPVTPPVFLEGPVIAMRVSKDGGNTFGNYRKKTLISAGHYRTMLRWRGLGMGRDYVFEISWSASFLTGLNQAYANGIKHAA